MNLTIYDIYVKPTDDSHSSQQRVIFSSDWLNEWFNGESYLIFWFSFFRRASTTHRDASRMADTTGSRSGSRPRSQKAPDEAPTIVAAVQAFDKPTATCRGTRRRWHDDDGFSSGRRRWDLSADNYEHGIVALSRSHDRQLHQRRRR